MRIDRMLAITILLLNRKRVTARELAERFEVSIRTVYRDLDAINLAGIPIISYPGNEGGYCLMDNFKVDRQFLTVKDMVSIISALKGINLSLEDQQLNTTLDKIRSLVPKHRIDEIDSSVEQVVIDAMPWGGEKAQKEKMKLLHKAIIDLSLVSFTYTNAKGERMERKVEPMTLIFKGYGWYLFAFCLNRNDFRMFRLSRIRDLERLDQEFIRKNRSYSDFLEPFMPPTRQVDVVLRFSPESRTMVEDYFSHEEIQVQSDGNMIVKTKFSDESWLYPYVLSYGERVEVLEPSHIRDKVKEKIKKILAQYQH